MLIIRSLKIIKNLLTDKDNKVDKMFKRITDLSYLNRKAILILYPSIITLKQIYQFF
jgi:hypothetical protein